MRRLAAVSLLAACAGCGIGISPETRDLASDAAVAVSYAGLAVAAAPVPKPPAPAPQPDEPDEPGEPPVAVPRTTEAAVPVAPACGLRACATPAPPSPPRRRLFFWRR